MKNYYSITIHYWMVSQLRLSGLELLVYAGLFDATRYETIDLAYLDEIRDWATHIAHQFFTMKDIEAALKSLERKELINFYKDENEVGISHHKLRKFGIIGEGEK